MKVFVLIAIWSLNVLASSRDEAQDLLNRFHAYKNIPVRLDLISENFLGLPYGDGGPLGEGEKGRYDQDPLYRFDTFDCTTFVETIVSLALTQDALSFEQKMNEIRYENSEVEFLKRNHFPSLQWIPNNIKNGLLSEINHLVLPIEQRMMAEAEINLPGWLRKIKIEEIRVPLASLAERQNLLEELHSYASQYSPVIAQLNYLPIKTLVTNPETLDRIPHGSIVNFVRPNWDLTEQIGTHMNVSHQGFLFRRKGILYLRHASSSAEKRVIEVPFFEYLKKFEDHPTLKGIHLMKVNLFQTL